MEPRIRADAPGGELVEAGGVLFDEGIIYAEDILVAEGVISAEGLLFAKLSRLEAAGVMAPGTAAPMTPEGLLDASAVPFTEDAALGHGTLLDALSDEVIAEGVLSA
ncbi:MAG: hypothetical protein JSV80_04685 [Acidobacteriota bacterium]|nr:MAG: hypothetical protein JSV80_04685 [Acidobacteriota bacterium]